MTQSERFRYQMVMLDQQVERASLQRRAGKGAIATAVEEGMSVAKRLDEEISRMKRAYNEFLERILEATIKALNCSPEEMELRTLPLQEDGSFFTSKQILSVNDVDIMLIERFQLAEYEYQFRATPIGDEDEASPLENSE